MMDGGCHGVGRFCHNCRNVGVFWLLLSSHNSIFIRQQITEVELVFTIPHKRGEDYPKSERWE